MPDKTDHSLDTPPTLRNNLLVYMYNYSPSLSCIPSKTTFNTAFKCLLKDEAVFSANIVDWLAARNITQDKCLLTLNTLTTLLELGFVDVIYNAVEIIWDGIECKEVKFEFEYERVKLTEDFGNQAINGLYMWLANQTHSNEPGYFSLGTKDGEESAYPYYGIIGLTFKLNSKGYEIAMSLAKHKGDQAVRMASISSARTAKLALFAAFFIAIGSVGGLVLKICEMFCPNF